MSTSSCETIAVWAVIISFVVIRIVSSVMLAGINSSSAIWTVIWIVLPVVTASI
jgi:hypothetical protein